MTSSLSLFVLPPDDNALAAMIQGTESVTLSRPNSKLLEVVRILRCAPGLKELNVTNGAFLRMGEKDEVYGSGGDSVSYQLKSSAEIHNLWDLEHTRPAAAPGLQRASITGTVQPKCFKQMEWLAGMLHGAVNLKVLKLSLFEYDSKALVGQLRGEEEPRGSLELPSMLHAAFPGLQTTRPLDTDDEEGMLIGQMMVAAILKRHSRPQLRIEQAQHPMEKMIEEILQASVPPRSEEEVARETALVAQCKADALAPTTGAFGFKRAVLKCMTYEEYDDVLQVLYTTHLPEGLEHLTMRAILRGSRVQSQFLYLPCLESLDLDHCEMDDAAFSILGPTIGRRMPALKRLTLRQNRLQDAELGVAVGPFLEEIDLAQNPITSRAASHLFRSMEHNSHLHRVDLAYTLIDGTVSFHGLNHWTALPAHLRIPYCLSDPELVRASQYMHVNVELELVGEMSQELACCGKDVMLIMQ